MTNLRENAYSWGQASGERLNELCAEAANIRDQRWGHTVTYSRKVFIPLTNLCRDTCGYCIFAKPPTDPTAGYLTPDQVLEIAEAGEKTGCKEALFSLGERPELRYPEAREALKRFGYKTTIDYLAAMCQLILDNTRLIPHANPGALNEHEMNQLFAVTGSMGMMLETISDRLTQKGMPHYECPDKHPRARLNTLKYSGRLNVPFTTGLLIGIGETWNERIDALFAIEEIFQEYGAIQEVIVQNFRAKSGIAMSDAPEPSLDEMLRTLAAARLILSTDISLQAPPNLMPEIYKQYIPAGLNDWGGVSPVTLDHINPEAAWPKIEELAKASKEMGYELKERLTVYPRYLSQPDVYLAPEMQQRLQALAGSDGLSKEHLVA